jgi:hypothetical protein
MDGESPAIGAQVYAFEPFRPAVDPRHTLSAFPKSNGELVGRVLAGSWRRDPGSAVLSARQVAQVSPLLVYSGSAALGWRRLKSLDAASEVAQIRGVAQRLVFEDVMRVSSLSQILGLLNGVGVTPLLMKGWALSQLYAEPYLRPYGDFDLLVRREDLEVTRETLFRHSLPGASSLARNNFAVDCEPKGRLHNVDLHAQLSASYALSNDELFGHAQPVSLPEGGDMLVPAPEHHLRIVILHLLKHGAWKPLWLCDVASLLEALDADFDWSLAMPDDPALRDWMAVTIGAAHALLGGDIDHLPRGAAATPPAWFTAAILKEWRAPFAFRFLSPRGAAVRDPRRWLAANWPNPIRAAFRRGVSPMRRHAPLQQPASFAFDHAGPAAVRALSPSWWREFGAAGAGS